MAFAMAYNEPMADRLRRLFHQLKGQRSFYQYYATVHPLTCEVCLEHHGEIYSDLDGAIRPPLHPDCRCTLLEFPLEDLDYYRERRTRMREKARLELKRRKLFRRGCEMLGRSPDEALPLFEEAVRIEIYLSEIEELCRNHEELLRSSPRLARRLRDLFLSAYQEKYDREKYRHLPERMRSARLSHGLSVIRELFEAFISEET